MQMISDLISGTAQSPASITGVKEPSKARRPEDEAQGRPIKPMADEYVPEEKQEPSGRYWPGKDEEGKPKIYFDDLAQPEGTRKKPEDIPDTDKPAQDKGAEGPEKNVPGKNTERCTGNTDKVDREIEKLKKQKLELEQQLSTETDKTKIKELEAKLAQVENELRQKDNDTYRRQHSTYTFS